MGSFEETVINSAKPVVVYFSATCRPCALMAPVVERAATKHKDDIGFVQVDVIANPALMRRFNIGSVPSFLIFEGGLVKTEIKNAQTESAFASFIFGFLQKKYENV